jgi:hypothetical protein
MQIIQPNDPNYVNTETYQRYTELLSYADLMDDVKVKDAVLSKFF